jgi:hypothetical protein
MFKAPFRHLYGGTEEDRENSYSKESVSSAVIRIGHLSNTKPETLLLEPT